MLLRSLIVQLKIIPLPVYLRDAAESETREVIASLGQCIRNNAATNIFNKDLDSRNYGVGRYGSVFLFDYDAVEKLTDVKIRTNLDREPGEEAVPGLVLRGWRRVSAGGAAARHAAHEPLCAQSASGRRTAISSRSSTGSGCSRSCCAARFRSCRCSPTAASSTRGPARGDGGLCAGRARRWSAAREAARAMKRGAAPFAFALGAQGAAELLRGERAAVQAETVARGARREAVLEQPRHVLRRDADAVVGDRDAHAAAARARCAG